MLARLPPAVAIVWRILGAKPAHNRRYMAPKNNAFQGAQRWPFLSRRRLCCCVAHNNNHREQDCSYCYNGLGSIRSVNHPLMADKALYRPTNCEDQLRSHAIQASVIDHIPHEGAEAELDSVNDEQDCERCANNAPPEEFHRLHQRKRSRR